MKSKYVNEANVKSSHAANTITMWLGIIGFIFFGFMLMAVLLYGDEDIFMISIIVLALIILSIVIAIRSIHYKKSLDNVYMYARYFEGDLDGYIYISDMTNVIGKVGIQCKIGWYHVSLPIPATVVDRNAQTAAGHCCYQKGLQGLWQGPLQIPTGF